MQYWNGQYCISRIVHCTGQYCIGLAQFSILVYNSRTKRLWIEHIVQVREAIGVGQFAGGAGAGAEKAQTGVLLASPRSTISAAYDVQTI